MTSETTVDLDSLVGLHNLSGCDLSVEKVESYGCTEDAGVIRFTLDDKTYTAVEDPVDGYRSCLEKIFVEAATLINTFPAVKVLARKKADGKYGHKNDTLELIDVETGKVVLEVGTENHDDYYPSFVGTFSPENMTANAGS